IGLFTQFPDIWNIVIYRGTSRNGPKNGGGGKSGFFGGLPQCRRPDGAELPEDGVLTGSGNERSIIVNSVFFRSCSGDDRGMVWVGHRREHAGNTPGMSAVFHKHVQVGGVPLRIKIEFRTQAVDGDEYDVPG